MNRTDQLPARVTCPLCGLNALKPYGGRGDYHLAECLGCGLIFVLERVPAGFGEKYYVAQSCERYVKEEAALHRKSEWLLDVICRLGLPGNRILDLGCGTGDFLEVARERGFDGLGIDTDPARVKWCHAKGLKVLEGAVPGMQLAPNTFDLIWISHVLEHIDEPNPFLTEVIRLMRPSAVLAVIAPNVRGISTRICRCHHPLIIPPEHLSYYSPHSLRRLVDLHGLTTERVFSFGSDISLKLIIAHLVKLQFLRKSPLTQSSCPFVEGRGILARWAYNALMTVSRLAAPALALLGGEELVGLFRKSSAPQEEGRR